MGKGWTPEKHLRGLTPETKGFCWTPEHGWVRKNENAVFTAPRPNLHRTHGHQKDLAKMRDPIIVELERRHALLPKLPEITVERLEWSLALLAWIMERDGPVVMPLFESLERELAKMRQTQDTVARAKDLLETYKIQQPNIPMLEHLSAKSSEAA